jgi:hypothetical protein
MPINNVNYVSWTKKTQAYLAENRLWFIVYGTITEPKSGEEQVIYMEKSAQATGTMFLAIEASQHVNFNRIEMDGPAIWANLVAHIQLNLYAM